MPSAPSPPSHGSRPWNWDDVHDEYWSRASDELVPVALRWKNQRRRTVLDLGCGIGRNAIYLAKQGFAVDAYDLSPQGIRRLREEASRQDLAITCAVGDMHRLPYRDRAFDCLLAFHAIYHTDMRGLREVIAEITRVLRPDGEAFMTFNSKCNPSMKEPTNRVVDAHTVVKTEGLEKDIRHTFVDYDDVKKLLAGLKLIKVQQIQDLFEDGESWHYFVLAEKPARGSNHEAW